MTITDTPAFDVTKKYYLNPIYIIRPDKNRAIISNAKNIDVFSPLINGETGFTWILNPLYAVIFSHFDGKTTLSETIEAISKELGMEYNEVLSMITPYINNKDKKIIRYAKNSTDQKNNIHYNFFSIPRNFLIEVVNDKPRNDLYGKEHFYIKRDSWDFDTVRLYTPTGIILMLNNCCVTECVYCYANKKHTVQNALSTDRILELIEEASRIGILSFELGGGEALLHKDCYTIYSALFKAGYLPHVSTKIPITEEQIIKLKEVGFSQIQFSIDAWDSNTLMKMLDVDETYFVKLGKTLQLMEKHNINVNVKSVITKFNSSVQSVNKLLTNLTKFKNINRIAIVPGERSLYKEEKGFPYYMASFENWNKIRDFVNDISAKTKNCHISTQTTLPKDMFINHVDEKAALFNKRPLCTGNVTSLYILPDGKVTICEELYWSPKFIVGDVTTQTIEEVWNSETATKLFYLSQNDFRLTSACKHCPTFSACRSRLGVCWKMILQAYGMDAWDLPDPRCALAPPPICEFYR